MSAPGSGEAAGGGRHRDPASDEGSDHRSATASDDSRADDSRVDDTHVDDAPTVGVPAATERRPSPRPGLGVHAAFASDGADERGGLRIAEVVVEKVAVAAASEVEHVGGVSRRILGIGGRDDADARPRVSARVVGTTVALEVRLTVDYPSPVRSVTASAREHISDRVQALTELTVTRVDIDVAALTRPSAARPTGARSSGERAPGGRSEGRRVLA